MKQPTIDDARYLLATFLQDVKELKPDDRSYLDRHFSVLITDTEKLIAYFEHYIAIQYNEMTGERACIHGHIDWNDCPVCGH